MRSHEDTARVHKHCDELIPWVVNGRANEGERLQVEAHCAQCSDCREELERQRRVYEHLQRGDSVILAPQAGWQKFAAELDDSRRTRDPVSAPANVRRGWLIAAVWVQGTVITALLSWLVSDALFTPRYTTLTSASEQPAAADFRVVFQRSASIDDINRILHTLDATIVGGPSEAGVYEVALSASAQPLRTQKLADLRGHPQVAFAEVTAAHTP